MRFALRPDITAAHPTEQLDDLFGRSWPIRSRLTVGELSELSELRLDTTDADGKELTGLDLIVCLVRFRLHLIARYLVDRDVFVAEVAKLTEDELAGFSLSDLTACEQWVDGITRQTATDADPTVPQ